MLSKFGVNRMDGSSAINYLSLMVAVKIQQRQEDSEGESS